MKQHSARGWLNLTVVAFMLAACSPAPEQAAPEQTVPQADAGQVVAPEAIPAAELMLYDREFPVMAYTDAATQNRVARAFAAGVTPVFGERGFLEDVLNRLAIDPASQTLVFSHTSLQVDGISAATPRAIYFNDDTYVAWVPGAANLEIATLDAARGPVFYNIAQRPQGGEPARALGQCLRCHDAYSMTGGGVPRFITGSGYTGVDGSLVTHEGWILTSDRTPLRSRWGGWYVSGTHGEQVHLGNIAVTSVYELERLEELRTGNLASLEGLLDTTIYLTPYSDIVALLVMEHQVKAQNAIVRANWDLRAAFAAAGEVPEAAASLAGVAGVDLDALVNALLLEGEATIAAPIAGTSGFREAFEARGPFAPDGRSLRALDLDTRLFRYPLSYTIYSEAFQALPAVARDYVYQAIAARLAGAEGSLARLSAAERDELLGIAVATVPGFAAAIGE